MASEEVGVDLPDLRTQVVNLLSFAQRYPEVSTPVSLELRPQRAHEFWQLAAYPCTYPVDTFRLLCRQIHQMMPGSIPNWFKWDNIMRVNCLPYKQGKYLVGLDLAANDLSDEVHCFGDAYEVPANQGVGLELLSLLVMAPMLARQLGYTKPPMVFTGWRFKRPGKGYNGICSVRYNENAEHLIFSLWNPDDQASGIAFPRVLSVEEI